MKGIFFLLFYSNFACASLTLSDALVRRYSLKVLWGMFLNFTSFQPADFVPNSPMCFSREYEWAEWVQKRDDQKIHFQHKRALCTLLAQSNPFPSHHHHSSLSYAARGECEIAHNSCKKLTGLPMQNTSPSYYTSVWDLLPHLN